MVQLDFDGRLLPITDGRRHRDFANEELPRIHRIPLGDRESPNIAIDDHGGIALLRVPRCVERRRMAGIEHNRRRDILEKKPPANAPARPHRRG